MCVSPFRFHRKTEAGKVKDSLLKETSTQTFSKRNTLWNKRNISSGVTEEEDRSFFVDYKLLAEQQDETVTTILLR